MKQSSTLTPMRAKYNNMRYSLLLVIVFSAINVVSLAFAEAYFLFSSYFSQLLTQIGYVLYLESEAPVFLIVFGVLALLSILPYLLCWIFSKEKYGWMIGALVLFSLDTLVFLPDCLLMLASGDFSMIIDLFFHGWVLFSLIAGVKYGVSMKKEPQEPVESPEATADFEESFASATTRTVTVTRKKSFVGSAAEFVCFVNGREVCRLKNGASASFEAPSDAFALKVAFANEMAVGTLQVPAGESAQAYIAAIKAGMMANSIVITPEP